MTAKHPDFTDVFYAKAKIMDCARKGLRLQDAGDKKGARAAYQEALQWEKEVARLEKLLKRKRPIRTTKHNP